MSAQGSDADVELVFTEIEAHIAAAKKPSRFQARAALLAIGMDLLAGNRDRASSSVERMKAIVAKDPETWRAAVEEELTLACTEHVRACDPRWLEHPRYDFRYTVAAREKLEARLAAAARIDLPASELLLDQVARADGVLEPHLKRHESRSARS
jgi:hypothetical protein